MLRASIKALLVLAVLSAALALAGPAAAVTTSVTQKQISPGVQRRVIWSRVQVAQYKVTASHVGYIHAQVNFRPDYNSCSIFIWDPNNAQIQNINQGWYLIGDTRAAVDYYVPDISADGRTIIDSDGLPGSGDEYLKGDVYNVVVVCYGGSDTQFNVWGYAPQTDLHAGCGSSPTNDDNVYYSAFRQPTRGWRALAGAPYGGPFNFRPTSEGEITCDLTWPADVAKKQVLPDLSQGNAPAVWEQYLYAGSSWNVVMQDYLTPSGTWWPISHGSGADKWWGLSDTIDVKTADRYAKPLRWFHYAPALDLVSSDPTRGPLAPLSTGVVTMGYKATLTWPANLWIVRSPKAIKKGAAATIKGTFALNGAYVAGAAVAVQKSVRGVWKTVRRVKTAPDGKWATKVKPLATALYRAQATGDPPPAGRRKRR